jgi:hypothetical protein
LEKYSLSVFAEADGTWVSLNHPIVHPPTKAPIGSGISESYIFTTLLKVLVENVAFTKFFCIGVGGNKYELD